MRRRRLSVFLAVAVLGPAAPAMAADTRFAAPNGSGVACTTVVPCTITEAITNAADDDTVLLRGTDPFTVPATITVGAITIKPEQATGAATIVGDAAATPVFTIAESATLQRLSITGTEGVALTGGAPVVINTLVRATDGVAVRASGTTAGATLLHVTAIGDGASGVGLRLASGELLVRNSVLDGDLADLEVVDGATFNPDHSNFSGATGSSQAADPALSSSGEPVATSPVVNAGVADAAAGTTDLAGNARVACTTPDIGAFEFQGCPPGPDPTPDPTPDPDPDPDPDPQPQQPAPQPQQPGPPPPVIQQPGPITFPGLLAGDFVDPTVRNLRARADRRRRVSVTLRTSEPVLVRFVVERRINGRRLRGRCVTGRRKGARCTRYVVVRRVRRQLRAGSVKANLGSLRSGTYRITARAQDAARNQSVRKRATVRVRARR